ncbi:MAG: type II toxin-antitoxin system prevent-host-death family antitoxin [Chloroflexi bacterium]|nr:type II toxin-antitoxin system prevent-host-death family antitoxin [Chloroflexota bacterium]
MITADVAELHAALESYLARVQTGEQVVVTDHGREIARLVPTTSASLAALDYEDLVASGIIIPPERKPSRDFWSLPRVPDPEGLVLKAVLAEREAGW